MTLPDPRLVYSHFYPERYNPCGKPCTDEAQPETLNQCDGCNRNLPLDDDGFHIDPSSALGAIGCDADLY